MSYNTSKGKKGLRNQKKLPALTDSVLKSSSHAKTISITVPAYSNPQE